VFVLTIFTKAIYFPYFEFTAYVKNNIGFCLFLIRMIISRRIRWVGHVARMGRIGMHVEYWWESQKDRDQWEGEDVGERTILK
jgi:hypothetical protein